MTAEEFNTWVTDSVRYAPLLNLFMDYETFGEHQWAESSIFDFFEDFVGKWLSVAGNTFYTVSELWRLMRRRVRLVCHHR